MGFDKKDNKDSVTPTIKPLINKNEGGAKKSIIKKVTVTSGNANMPKEEQVENVFFVLYRDPGTFAPANRTIYLSRHGESQFNLYGKIGGNASLSSQGLKYAIKLAEYFKDLNLSNFHVG